jgi:hypothetical protein
MKRIPRGVSIWIPRGPRLTCAGIIDLWHPLLCSSLGFKSTLSLSLWLLWISTLLKPGPSFRGSFGTRRLASVGFRMSRCFSPDQLRRWRVRSTTQCSSCGHGTHTGCSVSRVLSARPCFLCSSHRCIEAMPLGLQAPRYRYNLVSLNPSDPVQLYHSRDMDFDTMPLFRGNLRQHLWFRFVYAILCVFFGHAFVTAW